VEVDVVCEYVEELLRVEKEEDICVLTPYKKQQEKIRLVLESRGSAKVSVCTID
jgi:superfamily I DNA and/or RNA helicase